MIRHHRFQRLWFYLFCQESGMWTDALRVVKEYLPHKVSYGKVLILITILFIILFLCFQDVTVPRRIWKGIIEKGQWVRLSTFIPTCTHMYSYILICTHIYSYILKYLLILYLLFNITCTSGILAQARDWETKGEHSRAIDLYLKITPNNSDDFDVLASSLEKVRFILSQS